MQARRKCAADANCLVYDVYDKYASAAAAIAWPGAQSAAHSLGYTSLGELHAELRSSVEPLMALSTFCLTPPGDTPKRRGLIGAWMMGCIPVVFNEHSRELGLFLTQEESSNMSVLIDQTHFMSAESDDLTALLDAAAPPARRAEMRRAMLEKVTSLHWAYSDLGEADHAEVGPDAWDVLLHGLHQLAHKSTER